MAPKKTIFSTQKRPRVFSNSDIYLRPLRLSRLTRARDSAPCPAAAGRTGRHLERLDRDLVHGLGVAEITILVIRPHPECPARNSHPLDAALASLRADASPAHRLGRNRQGRKKNYRRHANEKSKFHCALLAESLHSTKTRNFITWNRILRRFKMADVGKFPLSIFLKDGFDPDSDRRRPIRIDF